MKRTRAVISSVQTIITVGIFLGIRDLKRSNPWTTSLIIFIMTITFLNLIVVRGILIGLVEGANIANKHRYSSDIIITTPSDKTRIERSSEILLFIEQLPYVNTYSARYTTQGRIEAGYRDIKKNDEKENAVGTTITGIDIAREEAVTQLSETIIEGTFLRPNEPDTIVIGTNLLAQYQSPQSLGSQTLTNVAIGSKVKLTVGSITREVTVVGFMKAKSGQIDQRILIHNNQLRSMMGRTDFDVNEIAVLLKPHTSPDMVKNIALANKVGATAVVQTALEGRPQFIKDIEDTFNILGNVIGSIGLAVATISIFIVIFVNAITRRKYIGILKGIGIQPKAIELSYMIQSFFYAVVGIIMATSIIFGIIKPYIAIHPINFPFSDGVLVASVDDVIVRAGLLLVATIIAGYIPAHLVVRQRTLDAILGR